MSKYNLDMNKIYGICKCGCIMIVGENDVYKPLQVENYKEITNTYNKNFWCCNGCINDYYKDGQEHSWSERGEII